MPTQKHANWLLIALAVLLAAGCAHIPQNNTISASAASKDPKLRIMLARIAENEGNTTRALELYDGVDDPYAWLNIARIRLRQKEYPAALAMIEKVIASGTYLDEALEVRMQIYVRTEKWREAIGDLEKLAKRYPQNRNIRIWLANFKLIVSDFQGARKELESITIDNEDFMALFILAEACLGDNDKECAKQALEKAVEGGTDNPAVFIKLGRIYEINGDINTALEIYQELLEIDPQSKEANMAIIDLYLSNGQLADALEYLQKLYELDPANKEALRKIIIIQLENKQFKEALSSLKKQDQPSEMDNYYAAIAYAGLKQYEQALEALNRVQPQRPALLCDAAMLKATILEEMGRSDASITELRSVWENNATSKICPEVGYRLATALEEAGKRDEGIAVAQKVLEKSPHDSMMLNFIGYIWADEGKNLSKALSMIEEALKLRPDDGYILDSMGWVLYKNGRAQDAKPYIEKALKKYPDDPTINIHMGDIHSSLGNNARALDFYFKAKINTKKIDEKLEQKIKSIMRKTPETKVRK